MRLYCRHTGSNARLEALAWHVHGLFHLKHEPLFVDGGKATVVMKVHQPGFNTGAPGYVVRKGQFLTVITGGQRFLYRARADVTATGSGEAVTALRTLLRRPPTDNAVVELAQPMIEGFVRDLGEWTVGVDRLVGLRFTVRERE